MFVHQTAILPCRELKKPEGLTWTISLNPGKCNRASKNRTLFTRFTSSAVPWPLYRSTVVAVRCAAHVQCRRPKAAQPGGPGTWPARVCVVRGGLERPEALSLWAAASGHSHQPRLGHRAHPPLLRSQGPARFGPHGNTHFTGTAERPFFDVRSPRFWVGGYCTKWRIQGQFS